MCWPCSEYEAKMKIRNRKSIDPLASPQVNYYTLVANLLSFPSLFCKGEVERRVNLEGVLRGHLHVGAS